VDQVGRFETELLRYIHAEHKPLLEDIRREKDISKKGADGKKIEDTVKAALESFSKTFA
jgi:F0F1-type ATP synthase alpha subunit